MSEKPRLIATFEMCFADRRTRERTLEKLWSKNSGAMESFIVALEVNNFSLKVIPRRVRLPVMYHFIAR